MDTRTRAAAQAVQLGAIAAITRIGIDELLAPLHLVEPLLAHELHVGFRADGRELGLITELPPTNAEPSLARLDAALAGSGRPFSTLHAGAGGARCELELRTNHDTRAAAVSLRVFGERTRALDHVAIAALGLGEPVTVALLDRGGANQSAVGALAVRVLGGVVEVELARVLSSADPQRDATLAQLDELCRDLRVTRPQRGLLAQIHFLLARGQGALVGVSATAQGLVPKLTIRYAGMPWDTALRFASGLFREDTPTVLGRFAGSVGAEAVAWLELELGPQEPPRAWIVAVQRAPNHVA